MVRLRSSSQPGYLSPCLAACSALLLVLLAARRAASRPPPGAAPRCCSPPAPISRASIRCSPPPARPAGAALRPAHHAGPLRQRARPAAVSRAGVALVGATGDGSRSACTPGGPLARRPADDRAGRAPGRSTGRARSGHRLSAARRARRARAACGRPTIPPSCSALPAPQPAVSRRAHRSRDPPGPSARHRSARPACGAPPGTTAPVGNGPFRFVAHEPNRRWVFAADPDFPAALGGPPQLERLILVVVDEPTTKLAALDLGRAGFRRDPAGPRRVRRAGSRRSRS